MALQAGARVRIMWKSVTKCNKVQWILDLESLDGLGPIGIGFKICARVGETGIVQILSTILTILSSSKSHRHIVDHLRVL